MSHESSTCTQSRSRTRHRRDARIGDDIAPSSFHSARNDATRAAARPAARVETRRGSRLDSTVRTGDRRRAAARVVVVVGPVRRVESRCARSRLDARATACARAHPSRSGGRPRCLISAFSRPRDGNLMSAFSRPRDGTSRQPSRRRRRGILTLSWVNSVIEVYTSILSSCNFEHVEHARGTEIETWQLQLFV